MLANGSGVTILVVSRKERSMFVRTKPSGAHKYLQVVESFREGRRVRQRVVATLGRLPRREASPRSLSLIHI